MSISVIGQHHDPTPGHVVGEASVGDRPEYNELDGDHVCNTGEEEIGGERNEDQILRRQTTVVLLLLTLLLFSSFPPQTLLEPLYWQSTFLPILPEELMEPVLGAPVPILVGVQYKTVQVREYAKHVTRVNVYKDKVGNNGVLVLVVAIRRPHFKEDGEDCTFDPDPHQCPCPASRLSPPAPA